MIAAPPSSAGAVQLTVIILVAWSAVAVTPVGIPGTVAGGVSGSIVTVAAGELSGPKPALFIALTVILNSTPCGKSGSPLGGIVMESAVPASISLLAGAPFIM